ncbi:transcriptional regulator [Prauserella marina]|uniref:Helix-turn-helix domain-containing protein n=1 Tax=Prauserella marina TaxID=530584 RepID=A0A222VVP8_9PSEU|nr:helix-turn-helix transcriptional regulator [Prauserella marina]ASR37985.1 transcriptional regulator [Prauserella marina]PWV73212.1 helix-turn-helix protein [Prauserella marina]SDD69213.1 Helix-turn-helix domain-containing protein [Prauserella marina]
MESTSDPWRDLGGFLRSRRGALDPETFGLPRGPSRRRVPGLRREELAQLAGVSVDYYTRLEQGRARNVSDSVLDALSSALRLNADEDTYLRNLAAPKRRKPRARKPDRVSPRLRWLLDSMPGVPAMVLNRRCDVLAWNPLCAAIAFDFATIPPAERNIPRLFFLDEDDSRALHPEWDKVVKELVGNLRAAAGHDPTDPELASLVGELSLRSETFRKLWAAQSVQEKTEGIKHIRNPVVGDLLLHYQTLHVAAASSASSEATQGLVVYTAEPGSETERNLGLLASWVAGTERTARHLDASSVR